MCLLYTSFFKSAKKDATKSFAALTVSINPTIFSCSYYALRAVDEILVHWFRTVFCAVQLAVLLAAFLPLTLISPCGLPNLVGAIGLEAVATGSALVATALSVVSFVVRGVCTAIEAVFGEIDEGAEEDDQRYETICDVVELPKCLTC